MSNKVQRFIASERELSQLKHWLKTTYRISIEEFVVLYKVYADTKISGKRITRYFTFRNVMGHK